LHKDKSIVQLVQQEQRFKTSKIQFCCNQWKFWINYAVWVSCGEGV